MFHLKNKIVIFILLTASTSFAGIAELDSIFMHLDTNDLTTKYLYDKQARFIETADFKGDILTDSLSNANILIQLSTQFSYSNLSGVSPFKSDQLFDIFDKYQDSLFITSSLLYAEYDRIADTSSTSDCFYWSGGQLYDSVGRQNNPYIQSQCVSFAFLKDSLFVNDSNFTINFKMNDELIQADPGIDSLFIDFDNNMSYQYIVPNNNYSVTYSSVGEKNITARIVKDSLSFFAKFKFETIFEPLTLSPLNETDPPDLEAFEDPITGDDYTVWLSCSDNGTIKRPFIIVEGFDPTNERDYEEYQELLTENGNQLLDRLRSEGYDVILMNFSEGGDPLENNADNLEVLIDRLNNDNSLGSLNIALETDIRVMGISMGGIISRIALKNMENDNNDHNVGWWLTVDSPHQGAYISWGIQNFLSKYMDKIYELKPKKDIKEGYNRLTSDAAQEMLICNFGKDNINNGIYKCDLNANVYSDFYDYLFNLGLPNELRKIAFSNGSLLGNRQRMDDGSGTRIFPEQLLISAWTWGFIAGLEVKHVAAPEKYYSLDKDILYYRNEVDGCFYILGTKIYGACFNTSLKAHPIPASFESISGGYTTEVVSTFLKGLMEQAYYPGDYAFVNSYNQSFISTLSSLDLRLPNGEQPGYTYWNNNFKNDIYYGNLISPFDKYYALDNYNTPHALSESIKDNTIENAIFGLIDDLFDEDIAPIDLFLQNDNISGDYQRNYFESKEKIYTGYDVTSEIDNGDFIVEEGAVVEVRAGQTIHLKDGTHFKSGSYVHLKIENVFDGCVEPPTGKIAAIIPGEETIANNSTGISIVPNPTGDVTTITISLTNSSNITLAVFDMLGNKIHEFTNNEYTQAGRHRFTFNAANIPNGMYYVHLMSNDAVLTEPLIIAK